MKRNSRGFAYIFLLILLVPVVIAATYVARKRMTPSQPKPSEQEDRSISPSLFRELLERGKASPTISPEISPKPTPTPKPGQIAQPTFTPTPIPTSTPTPTPRVPNPPIMNISYPTEMQEIELDATQTLCVVDVPIGGDTSGTVQRRHNINDQGWSGYVDIFTLCFDPIEGLNRFSLQYKNQYGDESVIYTRQFNFHRI